MVISCTGNSYMKDVYQHRPGVILLDYWLDGQLGSDICKELKSDPYLTNIPVILISAVNGVHEIANSCDADDSLAKPFNIADLEYKVLKWLGVEE